ncbi:MAG: hypothetical protein Q8911_02535 [Bacillota bacterium]|nr:hypothetical protein [Bacillota bacterium]
MQALGVMLLVLGVVLSVRERRYLMMWRSKPASNQLEIALSQLVGTAGGIYLSLELLFSFLKIPEDWWSQAEFFVEPLAVISLLLAIVQPLGIRVWLKFRK